MQQGELEQILAGQNAILAEVRAVHAAVNSHTTDIALLKDHDEQRTFWVRTAIGSGVLALLTAVAEVFTRK